jgi:hypothetical protein
MEEKIGNKMKKRPYEKPLFRSEELFETAVLACGKLPQDPALTCQADKKKT